MIDESIVKQVGNLSDRVRKEAKELDKLPGPALAAVVGGSVVIGLVGGGLFWIPASMSGAMFFYRAVVTALKYPSYRKKQRINEIREMLQVLEDIDRSPLALENKQPLTDALLIDLNQEIKLLTVPAALEDKSRARTK